MHEPKIYRGVICHGSEEWYGNRRWIDLSVLKLTWGIWWILTRALASLKNLRFNWLLVNKLYNFWAKKVQKSYLSWHWRVIQNLKNNLLVIWKMIWGIWQNFTRALKVSKLGLRWDPFAQSRKCMSLQFTEKLCVITMKNDAKFEEGLSCHFKIDMRNLTNFDITIRKSKNFAL